METQANLPPQELDPWFLELLACPGCEQHHPVVLSESRDQLLCACGKYAFPIQDGIPILLVESATVLNENADPAQITEP